MIYYCEECRSFTEEDDLGSRMAREEDGVPRGTRVATCPECGSAELVEATRCKRCGKPIPDGDLCEECREDLFKRIDAFRDDILCEIGGDIHEATQIVADELERVWF